jgi:hypothetical protein
LSSLWFSLAAGLVLLIPGCSLLAWLPGERSAKKDPIAFLADGAALSISITACLALWLLLFKIKAGPLVLVVFYVLGIISLCGALLRRWSSLRDFRRTALVVWGWALVFGLAVGLSAWRFYQARFLLLPAWVDSVHHTLVVRKMIEYQGLPPDLTPYIPANFYYHYGFHLAAALFAFWTRLSPAEGVLWFGNVVNAAVAFSVYRAASAFLNNGELNLYAPGSPAEMPCAEEMQRPRRWRGASMAALAAALLVGFVFQMPAYYVTWGRYTLLTGLVLLGPALAAALEVWRKPSSKAAGIKMALLVAGLCLTHYFALLLAGFFLVVLAGTGLARIRQPRNWFALLGLVGWAGLGLLLALPWVWNVALATQSQAQVHVISPINQAASAAKSAADYLQYIIYLVGPRRNHILMGLAGIGLLAALRKPSLRPLAAWTILLSLLSLPWGVRIGPFRPDHYAIVLFFPAAILVGDLLVSGIEALVRLVQPGTLERAWFRPVVLGTVLVIFLIWGARETKRILNTTTILVDQGDIAALDWIQENTPVSARFYINSVLWQGNMYRGVDGGYWLMPYAGRSSLLPPLLYANAPVEYVEKVNRWVINSGQLHGCDTNFWNLVEEAGLTHIYLHQGKGVLQPSALTGCAGLDLIYEQESVYIYQIHPVR